MEQQFTEELISLALTEQEGNVTSAARSLGVTRSTLYNYLQRYPSLKTVLRDARESMLDHAESALVKAIKAGEGWAVCFTLKTIGRARGYVEKHEVVVTDEREGVRRLFYEMKEKLRLGSSETLKLLQEEPEPVTIPPDLYEELLGSDKVQ